MGRGGKAAALPATAASLTAATTLAAAALAAATLTTAATGSTLVAWGVCSCASRGPPMARSQPARHRP